jgi:hypothetical protein
MLRGAVRVTVTDGTFYDKWLERFRHTNLRFLERRIQPIGKMSTLSRESAAILFNAAF